MQLIKTLLSFSLLLAVTLFSSCQEQKSDAIQVDEKPSETAASTQEIEEAAIAESFDEPHEYGGWYCPDNLGMFPPISLEEVKTLKSITDRLPTYEESRNGVSLMYIDTAKIPSAKPLDLDLPRIAQYYNIHTKKNEVVVLIQAFTAQEDTVVGFRYLNGGNGSAYLAEVKLLSDDEIEALGATPFYFTVLEVNASVSDIWNVITGEQHAKALGNLLEEGCYYESDWINRSKVYQKRQDGEVVKAGQVSAAWRDLYLQLDYNLTGHHYAEKFFMYPIEESMNKHKSEFKVAIGPFKGDGAIEKERWNNWALEVKRLSESARLWPNK